MSQEHLNRYLTDSMRVVTGPIVTSEPLTLEPITSLPINPSPDLTLVFIDSTPSTVKTDIQPPPPPPRERSITIG